ncbi:MAG: hypothetical protein L3K07_00170 [Thermoplasmata archaeon]|nr:hypothetical protein [Thermoplasmata archaeon]
MPTPGAGKFYHLALTLVAITALAIAFAGSVIVGGDNLLVKVVIGVATGATSSLVILGLQQHFPRDEARFGVIRGHRKIYEQYEKSVRQLDDRRTHAVYTTSASVQSHTVAEEWDGFLTAFLRANDSVEYHRILVFDPQKMSPEWTGRLEDIRKRYAGLSNYFEYHSSGPATIEFLLVDEDHAFFTFPATPRSGESNGVIVRDPETCHELAAYARHLTSVLPNVASSAAAA